MEVKKALEELIPVKLRLMIVKCQNAYRFYIHIHQQNVELLQQAENSEAKRAIILAEQKLLEINEQQKKLLKEIDSIINDHCIKLKENNLVFDKDAMYGAVNRLISTQLEKTIAKARQKTDLSTFINNSGKKSGSRSNTLKSDVDNSKLPGLNYFSVGESLKDLPAVMNAIRSPKQLHLNKVHMSSNKLTSKGSNSEQIKNSRMNLLQALKKAKDESKSKLVETVQEDDDASSEDSLIIVNEISSAQTRICFEDLTSVTNQSPDVLLLKTDDDVEFIETSNPINESSKKRGRPTSSNHVENKTHNPDINSDHTSDKSSRRSSDLEEAAGEPVVKEFDQEKFLKYFDLYTLEQLQQLKTRRTSRRRRTCTSNIKKDFHYGNYDVNYVPVRNNKPQLFSPVNKKNKIVDPLAITEPPNKKCRIVSTPMLGPPSKYIMIPNQKTILNVNSIVAVACKDLKTCVACDQLEDVENMNACLFCYNFYHLQCHTMNRELRERENLCPDCLRQTIEKKKRKLELKKTLNFQVLQAQHKAGIKHRQQIPT